MARTPFKLRSGNTPPFKQMGSSPARKDKKIKLDSSKKAGSYDYSSGSSQADKFAKKTPKTETVEIDESKTEVVDPEKEIIIAGTGEKKSQSSRPEGVGPVTEEPSPGDYKKSKPRGGGSSTKPKKPTESKESTYESPDFVEGEDWLSLEEVNQIMNRWQKEGEG